MKVRWSRAAFRNLDRIDAYWTPRNPLYADRLIDGIFRRASKIAAMPLAARRRDDLASHVRGFVESNYVVLYRLGNESIDILRVIHGRRDVQRIMRRWLRRER